MHVVLLVVDALLLLLLPSLLRSLDHAHVNGVIYEVEKDLMMKGKMLPDKVHATALHYYIDCVRNLRSRCSNSSHSSITSSITLSRN